MGEHTAEADGGEAPAARFGRIAAGFTSRAQAVSAGSWDAPTPCEGWVARDLVVHMVEWMPSILTSAGLELPPGPDAADDPVGAWRNLADWLQSLLDDPATAERTFEREPIGEMTVAGAIDSIMLGDVLLHTWDLARATGQDERLDPVLVHQMYEGMLPIDDLLRQSGHYGPKVDVPDGADEQTRLIAFTGRTP